LKVFVVYEYIITKWFSKVIKINVPQYYGKSYNK